LGVLPDILHRNPKASFAFTGAPSVDLQIKKREKNSTTQRYRVYKYIVSIIIGQETFEHFAYERVSSYLLVNRATGDVEEKEKSIVNMFSYTYSSLDEIQ
jgi:hypothetical protein